MTVKELHDKLGGLVAEGRGDLDVMAFRVLDAESLYPEVVTIQPYGHPERPTGYYAALTDYEP